jgi:23S rRNA (adenine2503-C2)-methyltransferase
MNKTKQILLGLTLIELKEVVKKLGMPAFSAKQIATWMYDKRVTSIDEMTNLSLKHREQLKAEFEVGITPPVEAMRSVDGTIKYLFELDGKHFVEAVYIPDKERATLCVSCQVGCKMHCAFCMTGRQGFTRHLTTHEIMNQIMAIPESKTLTNVVYMGMGEPMDNVDAILQSLSILTEDYGFAWSPKRITVSSVGLEKGLKRFLEESECHLAISLHTPLAAQRKELMPAEKGYPIAELVELLREYDFSKQRRLSFEYIMFDGVNDTLKHAKEIIKLLKGLHCRINLIRFHAIPDSSLEGSPMEKMVVFRDYLTQHGVFTTIRASRGEDIFAACGMLSTLEQEKEQKTT